jgi:hypothetical protein
LSEEWLPSGLVVPTFVEAFVGLIDVVDDDCDWWTGNRDFVTGIRGEIFDVDDDDDIQLFILELLLLLFVLDEYNCIKLLDSVWWTIGSVTRDDWTSKPVNKDWGRWFGSTVVSNGDNCLLSMTVELFNASRLCCFCRDVQAPIVDL